MPAETVAIGCDHAGFALKEALKKALRGKGLNVLDLGTTSEESVDYPDFGKAVAEAVASGKAGRGVAVCGSGIGMSIAANRNPKVRAALCTSGEMAALARAHNDANVLALGARLIDEGTALECLEKFLATPFEGGRHQRRVQKLGA
jgi:ribose 5-phosphate isomerase B